MRILIVTQYFTPEVGATQTRMHRFATNLAAMGHSVRVVCEMPNHPAGVFPPEYRGRFIENTSLDGFDVTRVWVKTSPEKNFVSRLLFYLSFMFISMLAGVFKREKYDIVFATSPPLFAAFSGYIISFFKRASFVMDVRDLWPAAAVALGELSNPVFIKFAEKLESFLYGRAERIVAVTRGFCEYIAERGIPESKLIRIPNGTVEEIFFPGETDEVVKERMNIKGKFLVTFAGNHGIAQGLHAVLDAAGTISDDDVFFLLVGEGPIKKELVERAERENMDNVMFHPQVPLETVRRFITASDATLVPLKNDKVFHTFVPSKMFDFMACGVPVLLSVDGEAREILEESGGGLFCKPEDPRDLIEKIEILKNDPALVRKMGGRGGNFVLQNYTRKRQAEKLEKLLGEITSGRPLSDSG